MELERAFKNIILAGIGTAAMAYEKAMSTVDEMVKKGELTVQQGKQLNMELKSNLLTQNEIDSNITFDAKSLSEILSQSDLATQDDIKDLKSRIQSLEDK